MLGRSQRDHLPPGRCLERAPLHYRGGRDRDQHRHTGELIRISVKDEAVGSTAAWASSSASPWKPIARRRRRVVPEPCSRMPVCLQRFRCAHYVDVENLSLRSLSRTTGYAGALQQSATLRAWGSPFCTTRIPCSMLRRLRRAVQGPCSGVPLCLEGLRCAHRGNVRNLVPYTLSKTMSSA